ncbi:unnamed protein product [[Candida] boidinii]|uniref:Unnamed protein product n=1 Tax=Candida boidinii TaxID=5477 RepID=A0ACB5TU08_CANBO|nr:unnamed protein product [[Candida] boidinii]GMF52289.1 unnamed protein product [[Candida] boidinii]
MANSVTTKTSEPVRKRSRRSRKKRRTEDFSSDSDSSSSSDSDDDKETAIKDSDAVETNENKMDIDHDALEKENEDNFNIDDLNINKKGLKKTTAELTNDTQKARFDLQKFETQINSNDRDKINESNILNLESSANNLNLNLINNKIENQRNDLLTKYLTKMTLAYGNDLDNFRTNSSDFNSMSLPLLAKLLKESGNIFDDSTLKSIVD